jgi:hypothetical protein
MIAPTRVTCRFWAYWRIGVATSAAAGRHVRNVYRLLEVRISLAPAFTRNIGTLACSARRAVASATSLLISPPIATT